jgi:putative phage-type endonuclease
MEQRSAEWFAARKGKVTGSRVGAILGVNQYKSRDDVMRDMVREWFDLPAEFQGNAATDHGTAMEPTALAFFREQLLHRDAEDVEEVGYIHHPRLDYVGASPDGIMRVKPGVNWRGGLEIKCPYYAKRPYSVNDPKKASYMAQCQLVMEVCDLDFMDFLCFIDEDDYLHEVIERDHDWWRNAEPKLEAFIADFRAIIANKKKAAPFLRDGDPVIDDPRMMRLAGLYDELKAAEETTKSIRDVFDELKRELAEEYGAGQGDGIRFAKQVRKGAVDWKRVSEDIGIDTILRANGKSLDDYRKPDTTTITVSEAA